MLSGTATEHSEVQLHLFADRAESVAIQLMDRGIAHEVTERRVKYERGSRASPIRACASRSTISRSRRRCFPIDGIRQAPVSPVDGKPMRRADAERARGAAEQRGSPLAQ